MSMSQEEKEHLASRVVDILRADDVAERIARLENKVAAGDEGEDGFNSTVLAIVRALREQGKR